MNDRRNAPKKAPAESTGPTHAPTTTTSSDRPLIKLCTGKVHSESPDLGVRTHAHAHTLTLVRCSLVKRHKKAAKGPMTAATKLKVNLTEWETGRESDDDDDSAIRATQNTALSRAIRSTSDFALAVLRRRRRRQRRRTKG